MDHQEKKWYALYTRSRHEKKTGQLLVDSGFEVYIPLVITLKQWSDRKKKVEEPLFRSYIFVKTSVDKLYAARSVEGAVYIVSLGKAPVVVPEEQIEGLQLLLSSDETFDVSDEEFVAGDMVEVMRGPLSGLTGSFVNYRGKKHVLLRVDSINQSLLVHIPPLWVKKV